MEDIKVLELQLKREVDVGFEVIKRCSLGFPQAILNNPLPRGIEGPIFSTPWWLTCPQLKKEIYRLETQHSFEHFLSVEFRIIYRDYRKKAAQKRCQLIDQEILEEIYRKKPVLYQEIIARGVAGETGPGLKCLHAHYAFFLLYPDYPLGRKISRLLPEHPEERCGGYCEQASSSN